MRRPFFITTAIPYVNGTPHVGFAFEAVLADAIARAHRDLGYDVRFQSGTDDHSLKNVRAAEAAGEPVAPFVERGAGAFRALGASLDLSFDDFISTGSDPRHRPGAEALWRACVANGDVYRRDYRGRYCVGCEAFLRDADLVDGCCPDHRRPPEEVAEDNYFFRLSRHQEWLRDVIASGELRITPASRRNEVRALVEGGLEDFSVSRSVERARGWGIPVPGDASQVQYVWFDALGNYITALGYPGSTGAYRRWWAGEGARIHVIGKNITRFHAVYWPVILRSAGLPLPTTLLVHGFVTADGRKVSKSAGGGLDPVDLAGRVGSDVLRYALLRRSPAEDFDLTLEGIERVARAELADQLGNLAGRVLALIGRDCGGRVPPLTEPAAIDRALLARVAEAEQEARAAYRDLAPDRAIAAVRDLIAEANRAIVGVAPWDRVRRAGSADDVVRSHLGTLAELLTVVTRVYRPIVPRAAAELARRLGIDARATAAGARVRPGPPLFPRGEAVLTPASARARSARR